LKAPLCQAAILEFAPRTARTWIVTTQFFEQFLVAMDDAQAALDVGLAMENPSGACSSFQKQWSSSLVRMVSSIAIGDAL
jgi:hypothetical protein